MNPTQSIFAGIFSTLTGVDTVAIAAQATEAENAIVAAVEVIVFFLAIITIELFVIMGHTKK
jgi:NADH:ubiquinone oxidoreductase subunit 6 (subunit J)